MQEVANAAEATVVEDPNEKCRDIVLNAVMEAHQITIDELRSKFKAKKHSDARAVVSYLLRKYTTMSYPQIGRVINKDHTSIMLAERRFIREKQDASEIEEVIVQEMTDA